MTKIKLPRGSRNSVLKNGVMKLSRGAVYKKKGMYKRPKRVVKVTPEQKPKETTKTAAPGSDARTAPVRHTRRYYLAEVERKPVKVHKAQRPTRLRRSLRPGTVVIILAGRYLGRVRLAARAFARPPSRSPVTDAPRGQRAIFLKQLPSGLLLINGPYKVNGVPLRRIDQRYVIATSTKIDIKGIKLAAIEDVMFKRPKVRADKSTEKAFFGEEKREVKVRDPERVKLQKTIDAGLLEAIKKVPMCKEYLSAPFSLKKGQYPHAMKF